MFSCFTFSSIRAVSNLTRNGVWWALYVWESKVSKASWITTRTFPSGKRIFGSNRYVFSKVFFNFSSVGFVSTAGFLKLEKKDAADIRLDSPVIFRERLLSWETLRTLCSLSTEGLRWRPIFSTELSNKTALDSVSSDSVRLEWLCLLPEELPSFIFTKFACLAKFDQRSLTVSTTLRH